MATFGPDKYRYELHFAPDAPLPSMKKAVYVSALHKLHRRDRGAELAYLVRAFFEAVAAEPTPLPSTLAGNVTNQINRFAIALFEEGTFLHLDATLRRVVVDCLLEVQRRRQAGDWAGCARQQRRVLRVIDGVSRGRLCSVAMRHVADGRPVPDEAQRRLSAQLAPEAIARAKASAPPSRATGCSTCSTTRRGWSARRSAPR
jgi:hypothetical protein